MSGDELDEGDEMELSGADLEASDGPLLDAWDITRRARAASGPDGRPALPKVTGWPILPFDSEGLRVRVLEDPVLPEPARNGEDGTGCWACDEPDTGFIWSDDRWRVGMSPEPVSIPLLTLYTRSHLDFHDLTEEMGAELGVLLIRAQRALGAIDGVGRVHVYKWGDGGAHLHVVLAARPRGMMQLRGMFLSTWIQILPPLPAEAWQAIRLQVSDALARGAAAV
jgi:diadenosine tetraphosphate (Ap4A) HIT family hydrolase